MHAGKFPDGGLAGSISARHRAAPGVAPRAGKTRSGSHGRGPSATMFAESRVGDIAGVDSPKRVLPARMPADVKSIYKGERKMRRTGMAMGWAVAAGLAGAVQASAQPMRLVSQYANGTQTTDQSREPSISADGRYVCFESRHSFVPEDTNNYWDIYVKDMMTGEIKLCSRSTAGVVGNGFSTMAIISGDGSIVCFMSTATNLVPNDTNNQWDYFVHDLTTRETTRISVRSDGGQANGGANCSCRVYKFPAVSHDGMLIAFQSNASNLSENDDNDAVDIFQHNRLTGETKRITYSHTGGAPNGHSFVRNCSPDGRFIAFYSLASDLVPDDTNDVRDIFIHDTLQGVTERISITWNGGETNDISEAPDVSADGRYVAFASLATNLVPDDTNGVWDVFLRDRVLRTTERISVRSDGAQGNGYSRHPSISDDGRWITFHSLATNFLRGDFNGWRDVFIHDRVTRETVYISGGIGGIGDRPSLDGFISGDGRWVVFDSVATNLVENDLNNNRDVFRLDRFGKTLTLTGPNPGEVDQINRFAIDGLLPGAGVILYYDFRSGSSPVDECSMIRLDLRNPKLVGGAYGEADGRAVIRRFIQGGASGRTVRFQAYCPTSCVKSNVLVYRFD